MVSAVSTWATLAFYCNDIFTGVLTLGLAVWTLARVWMDAKLSPSLRRTTVIVHVGIMLVAAASITLSSSQAAASVVDFNAIELAHDQWVKACTQQNGNNSLLSPGFDDINEVQCQGLVTQGRLETLTAIFMACYVIYFTLEDIVIIRIFSIIKGSKSLSSGDQTNLTLSIANVLFVVVGGIVAFLVMILVDYNTGMEIAAGIAIIDSLFSLILCAVIKRSLPPVFQSLKYFVSNLLLLRCLDFLIFLLEAFLFLVAPDPNQGLYVYPIPGGNLTVTCQAMSPYYSFLSFAIVVVELGRMIFHMRVMLSSLNLGKRNNTEPGKVSTSQQSASIKASSRRTSDLINSARKWNHKGHIVNIFGGARPISPTDQGASTIASISTKTSINT